MYSSVSLLVPLRYPNINRSAFVEHKELPTEPSPQSVVPQKFLNAVEHPKSEDAKELQKSQEPLDAVNQIGRGTSEETEAALRQPIKVHLVLTHKISVHVSFACHRNFITFWLLSISGDWVSTSRAVERTEHRKTFKARAQKAKRAARFFWRGRRRGAAKKSEIQVKSY